MKRLATLFVAACVLLAVGGVAYAAPADDVAPMDVQVWPGAEPGQLLVIVSTFLPESTKLPATVRIPVVDGMQLLWSGEIGGDAGGDIKIEPKIKKGVGGDYAEFEVTQFRQAQIELGSVALSQTAEGFSAKVDFVQTVPVDTTSFSARLPAGATNVKLDPAPASGPDRNQAGESLYTLPSKQLKAGERQTVSVSYAIGVGQAVDGGGSRNNVLGILVGLVAVAIVVLIVVVVRQRSRGASEHEDIDVADE